MKNIKSLVYILALTALPLFSAPCRAQDAPRRMPTLSRFDGRDWIYFAPSAHETLNFKSPPEDGSNVWVAAERSSNNRRILAKVPMWKDTWDRLHTVGVLKAQMEFNDYVRALRIAEPTIGIDYKVKETGILDSQTLAIPYMKLSARIQRLSAHLIAENAALDRLARTDAPAVVERDKFLSYVWEKLEIAIEQLNELNRIVNDTPDYAGHVIPKDWWSIEDGYGGLRGLQIPTVSQTDLKLEMGPSDAVRFSRAGGSANAEGSNAWVIDSSKMTQAILERIQTKEAAVERSVTFAENLCKDLINPPCK